MTTTKILDFMKLLKAGDNKRTIEYVDNMLDAARKEAYDKGYIDGKEDEYWEEYTRRFHEKLPF